MRDNIVFYRSFYEAVSTLPPDEKLKAIESILEYGFYDKEPEGNTAAYGMFLMARPQIDANNRRYENGKMGGRKPKENQLTTKNEPNQNQKKTKEKPNRNQTITKPKPNDNQTETKPEPNVNVNVNDNVLKENTLTSVKEKRFAPPTLENVIGYCREMGYSIDAERFINFYESKGWMVGKNKMKDWKAAVRNWAKQDKEQAKSVQNPSNRFNNFDQSSTDYDALVNKKIRERMEAGG